MSDTRTFKYPGFSLAEAIERARMIYDKEHMSAMTAPVAAEAMGYKGISGTSLRAISALKKYGLLEGRDDNVRLSKDAQVLFLDDPSSAEYMEAIERTALKPDIFSELHKQFKGVGSERNIAVYLEKQGLKPDAAATVARYYKDSLGLMGGKTLGQHEAVEEQFPLPRLAEHNNPLTLPMPRTYHGGGIVTGAVTGEGAAAVRIEPVGTAKAPFRITMDGNKLHIIADVDLKGLRKLMQMLSGYESMLQLIAADHADDEPNPID